MRFAAHFFLIVSAGAFYLISPSAAETPIHQKNDEWIAIDRSADGHGAAELAAQIRPPLTFVKSFGPDHRFSLLRGPLLGLGRLNFRSDQWQIQPNFIYRAADVADPDFEKSWGLNNSGTADESGQLGIAGKDIGAVKAWEITTGDRATVVAIVDSGIDITHEDLQKNIWVNPGEIPANQKDDDGNGYIDDVYGWNFIDNNAVVTDTFDHGTMAAGIIGSTAHNGKGTRGINWQVSMMSVKAIDDGGLATTAGAISAIHYAIQNGAKIINTSWGQPEFDQALFDEINWGNGEGALVVAAAGNYAKNNDTDPAPMYPAAFRLPNIIAVAAYDHRDQLADFSNFGPQSVHLGAPGVEIYTTSVNGYNFGNGTSFAAPFVTGVAALLKSYLPELSSAEIKDRILLSSEVIDYYQKDRTVTGGRVSAYNALANIFPPRPNQPSHWVRQMASAETPHPYALKSNLKFYFAVAGAHFIRVHFTGFATNGSYDKATLVDSLGRVVAEYSGARGDFVSSEAVGETVSVSFVSGAVGSGAGFCVDYLEYSTEDF
jgi:thermitase